MTDQAMTLAEMMDEIKAVAPTRKHNLAPYLLDGRTLAQAQAGAVLRQLHKSPLLEGVNETSTESVSVSRGTSAVPPPLSAFTHVPAGYYATRRGDTEVIDYWMIEKGKGKREGTTFARRVLGGQSKDARRLRTERLENMQQRLALRRITEAGLEDSQNLFADTLVRCIDCSSPLTDPESRAARKGRVCRNKAKN